LFGLGFDVLAENDGDTVGVADVEVADTVAPVLGLGRDLRASRLDLLIAGIDIPDPLEQVHTAVRRKKLPPTPLVTAKTSPG
jgi:hypothetical protein